MPFEDIMAGVVGRAITEDEELSGPWIEYRRTGDRTFLQKACGYGQKIPDTKLGAYYYSLVYQKQHYDVLIEVIARNGATFPLSERCVMVDFGAGPGTAALAWADYVFHSTHALPALSYVHVDQQSAMAPLCEALFAADRNLGDEFCWSSYRNTPTDAADAQRWVENADYAIFVFSYVLCQETVDNVAVTEFAELIEKICSALNGKPAYLLRIDAPLPSSWSALLYELRQLGRSVEKIDSSSDLYYKAVYLNPNGTTRDSRNDAGPAVYDLLKLQ